MKRRHPYAFSTKPGKGFLTSKHQSWAWGSSRGPFIRAFGGPDLFEGDLEPLVRICLPRGPPERRWACALAMGVGWCLAEVCREADLGFNKMDLELNLALCCVEEAEVWVEEARDEAAITKDMSHRVQWRASERLRRTDSCAPYRSRG
ncbi:hypothetical protein GW17_00048796 [Ensete ventricosum]|nr:hypothetical protein GW17_00048796 [Ensete ventricosum]